MSLILLYAWASVTPEVFVVLSFHQITYLISNLKKTNLHKHLGFKIWLDIISTDSIPSLKALSLNHGIFFSWSVSDLKTLISQGTFAEKLPSCCLSKPSNPYTVGYHCWEFFSAESQTLIPQIAVSGKLCSCSIPIQKTLDSTERKTAIIEELSWCCRKPDREPRVRPCL